MSDYLERLQAQVTPWKAGHHTPDSIKDIEAAIERIEVLQAALREIVDMPLSGHDAYLSAVRIARRALGKSDDEPGFIDGILP